MKYYLPIVMLLLGSLWSCENATKEIPGPQIFNIEKKYEVNIDSTLLLCPKITYDYESQYEWRLNGIVIEPKDPLEYEHNKDDFSFDTYYFKITTPSGFDEVTFTVHTMKIVDFEEIKLEKGHDNQGTDGVHTTKEVIFPVYNPDGSENWTGYAISNETRKEQNIKYQYSVNASSGAEKSKKFAVFHQDNEGNKNHRLYFEDGKNHSLKSISVNNTAYTALVIKNGDEEIPARAFDKDDWFLLTINGYDNNQQPKGSIKVYLADYRVNGSNKRFILDEWKKINLESLGAIHALEFQLSSSDSGTPVYFCLDNLKVVD
ncbi:DUF4465 domain-containing protein [Marinilabiliaceae bacterium JC017]|nr:DUF4465 domain-containing protein [Marinilabiliaceae bacterium JC017]